MAKSSKIAASDFTADPEIVEAFRHSVPSLITRISSPLSLAVVRRYGMDMAKVTKKTGRDIAKLDKKLFKKPVLDTGSALAVIQDMDNTLKELSEALAAFSRNMSIGPVADTKHACKSIPAGAKRLARRYAAISKKETQRRTAYTKSRASAQLAANAAEATRREAAVAEVSPDISMAAKAKKAHDSAEVKHRKAEAKHELAYHGLERAQQATQSELGGLISSCLQVDQMRVGAVQSGALSIADTIVALGRRIVQIGEGLASHARAVDISADQREWARLGAEAEAEAKANAGAGVEAQAPISAVPYSPVMHTLGEDDSQERIDTIKAQVVAQAEAEAVAEAEAKAQAEAEAEAQAQAQAQAEAEAQAQAQAEAEAQAQAQAQAEAEAKAQAEAEAEAQAQAQAEAEAKAQAEAEAQAKAEAEAKAQAEAKAESEPEVQSDVDVEAEDEAMTTAESDIDRPTAAPAATVAPADEPLPNQADSTEEE